MIDLELQGRVSAEFRRAEANYVRGRRAQVAAGLCAVIGVFVPSARVHVFRLGPIKLTPSLAVYLLTLLALGLTLLWVVFYEQSKKQRSIAEEARRSLMLNYGLGLPLPRWRRANLMACFSSTPEESKKLEDADYFATREPPGPSRLREITLENIFWSRLLCVEGAQSTWTLFAIFLVVCFLLLFSIPLLPRPTTSVQIAQTVCILLSVLLTVEIFGKARSFGRAVEVLRALETELEKTDSGPSSQTDILLLFIDYNSIIEGTPTVPTAIYLKMREKINGLWAKRQAPEP